MNTRKLMVKIVYGFNAVLIIVLVGLLIYHQRLIRQMSDNEKGVAPAGAISDSNTLAGKNTQSIPMADGGVEQLAAKAEILRYQLEAAEEELEMAREDLVNKKGPYEAFQESITMEKKERENPTLMKMRRRATEERIVNEYGAFFERLGLQDEKLQDLKALMVDNRIEMDFLNVIEAYHYPSLPEEDRKKFQQQLEDQMTEFEKQAKELLGANNYEIYIAYQESLQERSILTDERNPISVDFGFSEEKTQELIDAMYEARKDVEAKYEGFDATGGFNLDNPNAGEQIDRLLETYDAYIESARRVLSESQFRQFEARITEDKEGIKISRSLLKGDDDESR